MAVRSSYAELNSQSAVSAISTGRPPTPLTQRAPFIVSALFPMGNADWDAAPNVESVYLANTKSRTLALGYVRTVLSAEILSPWIPAETRGEVYDDLAALDHAMETWVGRMNEIAELYEENLIDRRLFVRKRSVSLIQQLFAAEPYILWRNSTTPGRWGLRVLGVGAEARFYHWNSHLQNAAIRLRVDPGGYRNMGEYRGLGEALGWIIGPGTTAKSNRDRRRSER